MPVPEVNEPFVIASSCCNNHNFIILSCIGMCFIENQRVMHVLLILDDQLKASFLIDKYNFAPRIKSCWPYVHKEISEKFIISLSYDRLLFNIHFLAGMLTIRLLFETIRCAWNWLEKKCQVKVCWSLLVPCQINLVWIFMRDGEKIGSFKNFARFHENDMFLMFPYKNVSC